MEDTINELKRLKAGKKIIAEYGEAYYVMVVSEYLTITEEGKHFEWVNKDTLEMKECNKHKIVSAKRSIMNGLDILLEYDEISGEECKELYLCLGLEEDDD